MFDFESYFINFYYLKNMFRVKYKTVISPRLEDIDKIFQKSILQSKNYGKTWFRSSYS